MDKCLKEEFKKIKSSFSKSTVNYLNQDEILKDQDNFFLNFLNISLFEDQKVLLLISVTINF